MKRFLAVAGLLVLAGAAAAAAPARLMELDAKRMSAALQAAGCEIAGVDNPFGTGSRTVEGVKFKRAGKDGFAGLAIFMAAPGRDAVFKVTSKRSVVIDVAHPAEAKPVAAALLAALLKAAPLEKLTPKQIVATLKAQGFAVEEPAAAKGGDLEISASREKDDASVSLNLYDHSKFAASVANDKRVLWVDAGPDSAKLLGELTK